MDSFIVGWGHTKFGKLEGVDLEALITDAAREALSHAGVTGAEVDGVWLGNFNSGMVRDGFCSSGMADEMQLPTAPALGLRLNLGGGAVNSAVSILEPVKG